MRDYISRVENVTLSDNILRVKVSYGHEGHFDVDISDPAFPHLANASPRAATWQYMKRRARRLLRELSQNQPERYWAFLMALLHESTRLQPSGTIDPKLQWALMWALHGVGCKSLPDVARIVCKRARCCGSARGARKWRPKSGGRIWTE